MNLTCGSRPLYMHGSYESNFNIRNSIKIIGVDVNLKKKIRLVTAM